MDYIPSLFQVDQIDELLFQLSPIPCQQHTIQENLLVAPSLYDSEVIKKPECSRRLKSPVSSGDIDCSHIDQYKKKKMIHRDLERQRRQEMATLYKSLRSHLPIKYLKGKRSISDHMHEAVNYIKNLQKRVQELNEKRDELKRLSNTQSLNVESKCSQCTSCPMSNVTVKTSRTGVEVFVGTALRGGLSLSKVLDVLIQEGLTIVCCISTKANERLLHHIQSEVSHGRSIDPSELQKKLTALVSST